MPEIQFLLSSDRIDTVSTRILLVREDQRRLYWDGLKFQERCVLFVTAAEVLYPTMQIVLEVDHSSGHLKDQTDELMVNAMNVRWGGKESAIRDTVIEEGCLGPDPPVLNGQQLTTENV